MEPLNIDIIHLYAKENSQLHHTDLYELVNLDTADPPEPSIPIVRRGQPFTAALGLSSRDFNEQIDIVRLIFTFGPTPNFLDGTKVVLRLSNDPAAIHNNKHFWSVKILGNSKQFVQLEVRAPSDVPVGAWQMAVETSLLNNPKKAKVFEYDRDIFILFNPWNRDDLVYMPDQRLLDEYVLTDVGKIWVGPFGSSRGREWVFGQFDRNVLPAVMLMLHRSGLPFSSRGDPIKLTRIISKMVNSMDNDGGIIVGSWDGVYEDGTAPSAWSGSIEIMEKYFKTGEPVKYGQCWVFAGVVTTVCRALGIPSRVISNLVSAHDANSTLSVDKYFNETGEELENDPNNPFGTDSIWNYHVWNDVWMARPDLPKGYGGWQAIDSTPQEVSQGFYQCGPTSLEAIKQGSVGFNYDVPFMISSVNADLMRWKEDRTKEFGYTKIDSNKYHIGRIILTKTPFIYDPNGDKDREDITLQYKAKEGSEAERLSLMNAVRSSDIAKRFFYMIESEIDDIDFALEELNQVPIGEDFIVAINIKNKSNIRKQIRTVLTARSVYYNGVKAKVVKKVEGQVTVAPKEKQRVKMIVKSDDYLDKLVEYCQMKIYAVATVIDTNQTWADEDDFQVMTPNIDIHFIGNVVAGRQSTVKLSFKNPLHKRLTNCKFRIEGPNLIKLVIAPHPDVEAEQIVEFTYNFIPPKVGLMKIVATFVSRELVDITGSKKIEVLDEAEVE